MSKTIQIRVDEKMKEDVEELFSAIGLDISTAVRMFFAKSLRVQGLPFEPRLYNEEMLQALEDSNAGRNLYGPFDSTEAAMKSMLSDEEDIAHRYTPSWAKECKVPCVAEESDDEYKV